MTTKKPDLDLNTGEGLHAAYDLSLSLEDKVNILRENGVDVVFYHECSPPFTHPTIVFRGDDNEGQRAAAILQDLRSPVHWLLRGWSYRGDLLDKDNRIGPVWFLIVSSLGHGCSMDEKGCPIVFLSDTWDTSPI